MPSKGLRVAVRCPDHEAVGEDRTSEPRPYQRRATVRVAADALGISEGAVRMRVKRGTLPSTREGGRLYVLLHTDPTTAPHRPHDLEYDRTSELLATLREQLKAEREANRENRRIIAALSQHIPEPGAPQVAPEHPERASVGRDEENPIIDAPSEVTRDSPTPAEDRSTTPRMDFLSRGEILTALLPRPRQELPDGARFMAVAYSVSLCGIAMTLWFMRLPGLPELFFTLAFNSPLLFGFWLSIRWLGKHPRSYVLSGLIICLVLFIVMAPLRILFNVPPEWAYIIATVCVSPALMFVAGGLLGDLVKGWAAQGASAGEYPAAPGGQMLTNREKTWDTIVVALITGFATMMVPILNWFLGT
jgi:hypothetical protein